MDIVELKDRILKGSCDEIRENGIKFTMDSLANRLGISKRTLYEVVPSKSEVIDLMIDQTFFDVKQQQAHILTNPALTTLEKLERLFTVVPAYVDKLDYRRINEMKKGYPSLYKKVMNNIESDWEPTIELLKQAMNEGVIRDCNIIVLKFMLTEIFEQLLNGNVLIQNDISYEKALREMISIVLDGIKVKDTSQ